MRSFVLHRFRRVLFALVAAYAVYLLLAFLGQRYILFPGVFQDAPALASMPAGVERHWLDLPSGRVEMWYVPAPPGASPRPAAIFAHGNYELIDMWVAALSGYRRLGIGLLLVEYPGFGRSGGRPSQESITEAFAAGRAWLLARPEVDPAAIIYHGRSIGGGVACALAARHPPAALILDSTFESVASMAWRRGLPPLLLRDPFDNIGVVRNLDAPLLVFHGTRDTLIPVRHGRTLVTAARRGTLVERPCTHNDCPLDDAYWATLAEFLQVNGI